GDERDRVASVFNETWKNDCGFVPFAEAGTKHMASEMRPLIDTRLTLIAEIDTEPIAFVICVPDINVILQRLDGRLMRFGFPIGLIKLLYYRSKIRKARLVALGVLEKYRRTGIAETLVLQVM